MYSVNNFISSEMVSALGWTLINILWQGFIVAFLLAALLKLFRSITSQVRYLMAITSLILIVGLSVYNFIFSYDSTKVRSEITVATLTELPENTPNLPIIERAEIFYQNFPLNYLKNVDKYFPILVNIWLAGIVFLILKFSIGLLYFQRIRKKSIQHINHLWIDKFYRIEQKLSLDTRIRYVESAIVKIPMVLGYLKPLIIIPAGMLTGIPENQIEAIIAHELAHIKRHDFLVNIFQSVIEMVFFFHPAVWYISSVIRAERENCCDDIAIAFCDESITYAKALVSVQEHITPKVYHAVAFSGQKKQLLNRVKRVIMKPRMKSNLSDKIIAALIVVAGVSIAILSASFKADSNEVLQMLNSDTHVTSVTNPSASMNAKVVDALKVENSMLKDTTKRHQEHVTIDIEGNTVIKNITDNDGKRKEMKFSLKNGKIAELYVDGKKIPESDYSKYQPEIDKTIAELKKAKEDVKKAMEEVEKIDIEKIKAEVAESMKDFEIDKASINIEIAKAMEEAKNVDIEKAMKEVQESIEHMKSVDFNRELIEIQESIGEIQHVDMEEIRKQMEEVRMQMENIDVEEIKLHIEKTRQNSISEVDMKKIQEEMSRIQEEMSKIDMDKINLEVEENLKSIDKEKMLKEMQSELEKLEELELDKK